MAAQQKQILPDKEMQRRGAEITPKELSGGVDRKKKKHCFGKINK